MKKYLPRTWEDAKRLVVIVSFIVAAFFLVLGANPTSAQADPEQSGSVGITGSISAPPPTQAATITTPGNGQSFTDVPVPVRGLCQDGLLVKLFKNNVFAGSAQCSGGTYEISIDLFTGTNELVARVFDDLDQPGPDSNVVTVEFVDNKSGAGTRVSVTSNFAKRGASPTQTLTWPIIISGGNGPYAISVDWGDGSPADLLSQAFPGVLSVSHEYDAAGVYNIIIKVSDANGVSSFLQVVGVANGKVGQTNEDGSPLVSATSGTGSATGTEGQPLQALISGKGANAYIWLAVLLSIPFFFITFWLGSRHMKSNMKKRILRGEHPFSNI